MPCKISVFTNKKSEVRFTIEKNLYLFQIKKIKDNNAKHFHIICALQFVGSCSVGTYHLIDHGSD